MKSLIFWKNFHHHIDGDFVALRPFTFKGTEYAAGDAFNKDDASRHQLKCLFQARKIVPGNGDEKADMGNPIAEDRTATIEEAGAGWLHVLDKDGNKIGKSTRDQAEAEAIRDAYLAGEDETE